MNPETLVKTIALAQNIGHVLVATADSKGLPHVAPADKMTLIPEEKKITVEAWFCPGTVANLQANRQVALVIWDPQADKGYQVVGETEGVEDVALLDGYVPGLGSMLPQGKKRLYIRVAKVVAFQHAPHTDQEQ
jgi:general stress protein 26